MWKRNTRFGRRERRGGGFGMLMLLMAKWKNEESEKQQGNVVLKTNHNVFWQKTL